jgi:hypothetical protein
MIGAAGLGTVTISGSASAKREAYPEVDNPYPEATVADLKQQAAMHPNLNRAAFITTALNDTRELYVATGVQSLAEQPDFIEEWQTGAFLIVLSVVVGALSVVGLNSVLPSAPVVILAVFLVGTIVAFVGSSFIIYGR